MEKEQILTGQSLGSTVEKYLQCMNIRIASTWCYKEVQETYE